MIRSMASLTLFFVLSSNLWAGNLLVVDKSGSAPFTEIQAAINAAADGDTVFVKSGHYAPVVIDGKAVRLIGEIPGGVVIDATAIQPIGLQIRNLASGKSAFARQLLVHGASTAQPALLLDANAGAVRIEICDFTAKDGTSYAGPSGDAAWVKNGADAAFSYCHFFGGNGKSDPGFASYDGGYGGEGLELRNATLALFVCEFTGGAGGDGVFGGRGGDGLKILGPEPSQVFAAHDNWFHGGNGGDALDLFENAPGSGGNGLTHVAGSTVRSLANLYFAGQKGQCLPVQCYGGSAGAAIAGNGQYIAIPGTSRRLDRIGLVLDGFDLPLSFYGQPGDQVVLLVSLQPSFSWYLPWSGIKLATPVVYRTVLGNLPGNFSIPVRESFVNPGESRDLILQPVFVGADGITLGNAQNVVVLDSAP